MRTPQLDGKLEDFGCRRKIDVDLCSEANGVEVWRKHLLECTTTATPNAAIEGEPEEEDAAASLLALASDISEADLDAQLNKYIARSHATQRSSSSEWLATAQNLPTANARIATEEEVALFMELLPSHLGRSGNSIPNWTKFCDAFNKRVMAYLTSGSQQSCSRHGCASQGLVPYFKDCNLRFKTPADMKAFAGEQPRPSSP